jgi:hypothetical protein
MTHEELCELWRVFRGMPISEMPWLAALCRKNPYKYWTEIYEKTSVFGEEMDELYGYEAARSGET